MRTDELLFSGSDRTLAIQAAPEAAGYPVLVHPGTPGARHLYPPQVEKAAQAGIRLISWDRPGYCGTPGRPGRQVAEAATEAAMVADYLGLGTFGTWGFSGGGPFALACAALLPGRLSAAVVLASLAPYGAPGLDWTATFSEEAKREVELFFTDPAAHREMHASVAATLSQSLGEAESWLSYWGERAESDEAHGRAVAEHLAFTAREALRDGDEGWYEDDAAFLMPWGFALSEIAVPVQLWHGSDDANVPVSHGRFLASAIPGIEAHILEGRDHGDIEVASQEAAWRWLLEQGSESA